MTYLKGADPFQDREAFPFPDLLMLDLKMPQADGFEVLATLRNRPPEIRLPVIVFSGSGAKEDMQTAFGLGAAEYFVKPVSLSSMAELVNVLNERWFKSGLVRDTREQRLQASRKHKDKG